VTAGLRGQRLVTAFGFALVVGWILLAKLLAYERLGTTSDLYSAYQLATTWLDGNFLYENAFGQHLSMHTYFLTPLLAVVAVPFGPPGLLGLVALSAGASFVAAQRILEDQGWSSASAGGVGLVLLLCPLSFHLYFDSLYGFHIELLAPALSLWLLVFLLRGRTVPALAMAFSLILMKEEIPLLVAVVAGIGFCESWIGGRALDGPERRRAIRRASLYTLALAVVGLAFCMAILEANQRVGPSWGSFSRLVETRGEGIGDATSLVAFALANAGSWFSFTLEKGWLALLFFGSFGAILFRPHYVVLGFGLSITAWMMRDDPLWPARLAPTWSFLLCVSVLGAGSARRLPKSLGGGRIPVVALGLLASVVVVASLGWQWSVAPSSKQVYTLKTGSAYSAADRADADHTFAYYEAARGPADPVIAATLLFRYADADHLYWSDRLENAPFIEWILWDGDFDFSSSRLAEERYAIEWREGRFVLYRRRGAG
jgi:hypothetical protein